MVTGQIECWNSGGYTSTLLPRAERSTCDWPFNGKHPKVRCKNLIHSFFTGPDTLQRSGRNTLTWETSENWMSDPLTTTLCMKASENIHFPEDDRMLGRSSIHFIECSVQHMKCLPTYLHSRQALLFMLLGIMDIFNKNAMTISGDLQVPARYS